MAASEQGTPGTGFEDVQRDGNRVAGAEDRPGRRLPSGVDSGGSTCKNGTGQEITFHELVLTSVRESIGPRGYFPGRVGRSDRRAQPAGQQPYRSLLPRAAASRPIGR
jgi:hypothetical protein